MTVASPAALRLALALQGLTLALAVVAWNGSAGEAQPSSQMAWVALASLAVVLSGAVNAVWLLRARRAVGLRQRRVADLVRAVHHRHAPAQLEAATNGATAPVAVDGMAYYHRPDCVLMERRKGPKSGRASEHEAAGRQPCGWCRP